MDQTNSTSVSPEQRSRRRRRFVVTGLIAFVLAVLVLTPPYINVNRFRKRIATTLSNSLGRPVHLDNVSLHVLPVPGLTLQNLVVSEDPAFGYEPVIHANSVEATLRATSLWRRQVEFSTVRFINPSVNLVRNAGGKWNLEEVLMQASHVDIAPTAQRKAGPAPRFPYIEATGARVNVKLGDEKMPFSLTDSDFALWLPSPETWRVRLSGHPARTDNNVADTGSVRLEGSLQRAAKMADVPVDLSLSWRNAPLGAASILLTGNDAEWRGSLFTEFTLTGPLHAARLTTHTQFNDLRRADFVPADLLDVTIDCAATADVPQATLANAQCVVPVDNANPITLTAAQVDLQAPRSTPATTVVKDLPLSWALGWARLFAPSVPEMPDVHGTVNGALAWNTEGNGWKGSLAVALPPAAQDTSNKTASHDNGTSFNFVVDTSTPADGPSLQPWVRLQPVVLHPAAGAAFTLNGQADSATYNLQLTGTGTAAQVRALAAIMPPLGEGIDRALPSSDKPDTKPDTPHAFALTCTRTWGGTQTCEPLVQPEPAKPARNARSGRRR